MMERTKERDMMMVRKSGTLISPDLSDGRHLSLILARIYYIVICFTGDNDKMVVQTKWKPLIPIDLPPPTTARGSNSNEKNIQYARERIAPPSLYYNKSM